MRGCVSLESGIFVADNGQRTTDGNQRCSKKLFTNQIYKSGLGCMDFEMFRKIPFICESLTTFVALERLLSRVHPHVTLQMIRSSASVIPLVTHEWPFSSVHPHHSNFQLTSLNEGKLTHCASVRLFPRVGPFVLLQIV